MLEVKGDFEKVKREMVRKTLRVKSEIRAYKKKIKELNKEKPVKTEKIVYFQNKIDGQEALLKIYNTGKVVPVQVGSIVINYKALVNFMKKIDDFTVGARLKENSLQVSYFKNASKGTLELFDLSSFFEGFDCIPVAELSDGKKT